MLLEFCSSFPCNIKNFRFLSLDTYYLCLKLVTGKFIHWRTCIKSLCYTENLNPRHCHVSAQIFLRCLCFSTFVFPTFCDFINSWISAAPNCETRNLSTIFFLFQKVCKSIFFLPKPSSQNELKDRTERKVDEIFSSRRRHWNRGREQSYRGKDFSYFRKAKLR